MSAWPVIERELRIRSRKHAVYFGRVAAVGIGVTAIAPRLLGTGVAAGPATGRFMLNALVATAFAISCGSCLLTSDAIGAERREGTLPLLFTTHLSSIDVLVGKLVPAGIVALCALVAFVPAFMLAGLIGGVTAAETVRKGLAVVDGLFLSLAIGLLVSAHENDRFRAARIAILVTMAIQLIPFFIGATTFSWVSPMRAAALADDVSYSASPLPYWISLFMVQAVAWLIIFRTDRRLRTVLRNDVHELDEIADGNAGQEIASAPDRRPPLGGTNPVAWLVAHQSGMGAAVFIATVVTIIFSPTLRLGGGWISIGSVVMWPLFLAMALLGDSLFAWAASRFFLTARRTAEIELLMTTPQGASAIMFGQWTALAKVLGRVVLPGLVVRGLWVGMAGAAAERVALSAVLAHVVLSSAQYLAELVAICALGMWFGLSSRGQPMAIFRTVILAKGVPYGVALIWSILSVHSVALGGVRETIYRFLLWFGQLIALAWPVAMIWWAQHRLREALPGVATGTEERRPATSRFYWDLGTDLPEATGKA